MRVEVTYRLLNNMVCPSQLGRLIPEISPRCYPSRQDNSLQERGIASKSIIEETRGSDENHLPSCLNLPPFNFYPSIFDTIFACNI